MVRDFSKVTCPSCGRRVSAYVPYRGDGSDVRIVPHKRHTVGEHRHSGFQCDASDTLMGEYLAYQKTLAVARSAPPSAPGDREPCSSAAHHPGPEPYQCVACGEVIPVSADDWKMRDALLAEHERLDREWKLAVRSAADRLERARQERAELLAALKEIAACEMLVSCATCVQTARAAIKKAEGR